MTKIILMLLFLVVQQNIHSQQVSKNEPVIIPESLSQSTIGISTFIKEHFKSDTARVRAIFTWVATNIHYDLEKFLARDNSAGIQPVADVLKTRLAVCRGYADLFSELINQCNINAVVVGGYTKQKGVVSGVAHAWVAAELEHNWYLFDPTWASGYINNNRFTSIYSETYFKLTPTVMIKDHMPFDPMYQFLEHTISNKEFIEGIASSIASKTVFNFRDTLQQFNRLPKEAKAVSELRRIKNNGIANNVIKERVDYLQKITENISSKNSFEKAMDLYKHSIALFNQYVAYKNKQFIPEKEDKDILLMVDSISHQVGESWNVLGTAIARDEANRQAIQKAYHSLEEFQNRINREKEFVATYVRMGKNERRQLFMKR